MKSKWIWIPVGVIALIVLVGYAVMYLWNWLMPEIFELPEISFYQALGLLLLSKILFSGFKGKGKHKCHHCEHSWKEKFKQKMMYYSEEDKAKFASCIREEKSKEE